MRNKLTILLALISVISWLIIDQSLFEREINVNREEISVSYKESSKEDINAKLDQLEAKATHEPSEKYHKDSGSSELEHPSSLVDVLDKETYRYLDNLFFNTLDDIDNLSLSYLTSKGFPNLGQIELLRTTDTNTLITGVIQQEEFLGNWEVHRFHTHVFAKALYDLEKIKKIHHPKYELGDPLIEIHQKIGDGSIPIDIEVALKAARYMSITAGGEDAFAELIEAKARFMNIYNPTESISEQSNTFVGARHLLNAKKQLPEINIESILVEHGIHNDVKPLLLSVKNGVTLNDLHTEFKTN